MKYYKIIDNHLYEIFETNKPSYISSNLPESQPFNLVNKNYTKQLIYTHLDMNRILQERAVKYGWCVFEESMHKFKAHKGLDVISVDTKPMIFSSKEEVDAYIDKIFKD